MKKLKLRFVNTVVRELFIKVLLVKLMALYERIASTILEKVQHRFTRLFLDFRKLCYHDSLTDCEGNSRNVV